MSAYAPVASARMTVDPPDRETLGDRDTVNCVGLAMSVTVVPLTNEPLPAVTVTSIPISSPVVLVTVIVVPELVAPAAEVYFPVPPVNGTL